MITAAVTPSIAAALILLARSAILAGLAIALPLIVNVSLLLKSGLLIVPAAVGQLAFHSGPPTSTHTPAGVSLAAFLYHSTFSVDTETIA